MPRNLRADMAKPRCCRHAKYARRHIKNQRGAPIYQKKHVPTCQSHAPTCQKCAPMCHVLITTPSCRRSHCSGSSPGDGALVMWGQLKALIPAGAKRAGMTAAWSHFVSGARVQGVEARHHQIQLSMRSQPFWPCKTLQNVAASSHLRILQHHRRHQPQRLVTTITTTT